MALKAQEENKKPDQKGFSYPSAALPTVESSLFFDGDRRSPVKKEAGEGRNVVPLADLISAIVLMFSPLDGQYIPHCAA